MKPSTAAPAFSLPDAAHFAALKAVQFAIGMKTGTRVGALTALGLKAMSLVEVDVVARAP